MISHLAVKNNHNPQKEQCLIVPNSDFIVKSRFIFQMASVSSLRWPEPFFYAR